MGLDYVEDGMKRRTLVLGILLATSGMAYAAKKDNPVDYNIALHVSKSEVVYSCNRSFLGSPGGCGMRLWILANLNDEILELRGNTDALIRIGDYKAKQVVTDHVPDYGDNRRYQILFPDGEKLMFEVVGEQEK
jgi:hypothetical protein